MSLKNRLEQIAAGWVNATNEKFADHHVANLVRNDLVNDVKQVLGDDHANYIIKSSAGSGNWASVPWLSILDPSITTSTQSGIYPVYLFRADGSGVYLSLGFGTTELKNRFGAKEAKQRAKELRLLIRGKHDALSDWGNDISLRSDTDLGKSYEWATAGAKFYPVESIPEDEELASDLSVLMEVYSETDSLEFSEEVLEDTSAPASNQQLPKPFLLLAGISGTGKTQFVRKQVENNGGDLDRERYCLTSVRPDWHEPSDLLGYVTRLTGSTEFVTTDFLRFVARAWRAIADVGVGIKSDNSDFCAVGEHSILASVKPYWLCLDEMNLAPVEQYFADYLSVSETREWAWKQSVFNYKCDPILSSTTIDQLDDREAFRKDLGLDGQAYDELWDVFCQHGIALPFNLIVAGTVNMDETTHGFSRKVIDRALTFDFGEFFPNDYEEFFEPKCFNKLLSYPIWSQARKEDLAGTYDADGSRTVGFLSVINEVLKDTPFELAYRALNEILLSVQCFNPQSELELHAVWDDFLMSKVLPRIEGDSDKLAVGGDGLSLFDPLQKFLADRLNTIWDKPAGDEEARPDLYREYKAVEGKDNTIRVACRSKAKIVWMQRRLTGSGFTSFWP